MTTYHQFSQDKVDAALSAANAHNELLRVADVHGGASIAAGGELSIAAECISVTVQNNRICLNLPLGIGNYCLPIPVSIPNGTAAEACLSICTTFGFPTGVKVTVSALGHVIIEKSFGKC
jgi:hypothetical protein